MESLLPWVGLISILVGVIFTFAKVFAKVDATASKTDAIEKQIKEDHDRQLIEQGKCIAKEEIEKKKNENISKIPTMESELKRQNQDIESLNLQMEKVNAKIDIRFDALEKTFKEGFDQIFSWMLKHTNDHNK